MKSMPLRTTLAVVGASLTGLFMLYGATGLSPFGHYPGPYGDILNHVATLQRHVLNVATAINFDYRGFDTLIEEYILFTAVAGVTVLFREQLGEHERYSQEPNLDYELPPDSDGIGWIAYLVVGVGSLFAIYTAIHGQLTPGGGFQAGAIAASTFMLVYVGQRYVSAVRFSPHQVSDALEAIGAAAYGIIGIITAVSSGIFLTNNWPLGKTGDVTSAGTIAAINACVFIEVAFGLIVCLHLFLKQTRKTRKDEG
jgi:multicomponent Na+:H+ antiporter subunit B